MARSRAQLSAGVDGNGGAGALALVASCCSVRRVATAGGIALVLAVLGLWANVAAPGQLQQRPATLPPTPTAAGGVGDSVAVPDDVRRDTHQTGGDRDRDRDSDRERDGDITPPTAPVRPVVVAASASNTPPPPAASLPSPAAKQPEGLPPQSSPAPTPILLPFTPLTKESVEVRRSMLPPPHGATELADLMVTEKRRRELEHDIATGAIGHTWTLTPRQACDLELLMTGGFTPLRGFMDSLTYASVLSEMRLPATADHGSVVWPMPITLDVPGALAMELAPGTRLALRDAYHNLIAVMTVADTYTPDRLHEASAVFGTTDDSHPGVAHVLHASHDWYVGGRIEGLTMPKHYDYVGLRRTPAQVRAEIIARGWPHTVAFQTRNPMHRAHIELTKLASREGAAGVLIHPVVGMTKPGDVEASVRVRCYQAIVASGRYYAEGGVMLSLLPLAMRMAGPKEALWHAIIRKNHGATHFIVGRDHAGCKSASGRDFYGAYDAQALVLTHAAEIGITILTYQEVEYLPRLDTYVPGDLIPPGEPTMSISGTKFRGMMNSGAAIPAWFSDPDVIRILRELMPPLHQRGFALFFTGLSGGGKTTIAHALMQRLSALTPTRRITLLDGDVVRTHLSKGLGFTITDRNTNVARIGWVAAEAVRHGGIVLASAIAPFTESREAFRAHVAGSGGGFFQIYVASSLAVCSERDVKGLYEVAAQGRTDLTGVSHPYELPDRDTDLIIDTAKVSVDDSVAFIVRLLVASGYIDRAAVANELTATETDLLTSATPPKQVFTTGAGDLAVSALHMCEAGAWDAMAQRTRADGAPVTATTDPHASLYGGLPMKASFAYQVVKPRRDSGSGAILAPPANIVLGLAHGPLALLLRAMLADSGVFRVGGPAGKEATAVYAVAPSRIAAVESLAPVGATDEARAATDIKAFLAKHGVAPTLTADVGSGDAAARALERHANDLDHSSATGTPLSTSLSQSARLYAAFDLWTAMRWHLHSLSEDEVSTEALRGGATSASAPAAGRISVAFTSPRLILFAQGILRLDPCARIIALAPSLNGSTAVTASPGTAPDASAVATAAAPALRALREVIVAALDGAAAPPSPPSPQVVREGLTRAREATPMKEAEAAAPPPAAATHVAGSAAKKPATPPAAAPVPAPAPATGPSSAFGRAKKVLPAEKAEVAPPAAPAAPLPGSKGGVRGRGLLAAPAAVAAGDSVPAKRLSTRDLSLQQYLDAHTSAVAALEKAYPERVLVLRLTAEQIAEAAGTQWDEAGAVQSRAWAAAMQRRITEWLRGEATA